MARAWLTSGFRFKSMTGKNEFNSMVYQRVTEVLESNVGTLVLIYIQKRRFMTAICDLLWSIQTPFQNRNIPYNGLMIHEFTNKEGGRRRQKKEKKEGGPGQLRDCLKTPLDVGYRT